MKTGFQISISYLLICSAFILGDSFSTGYPIRNGLGHGIFFGILASLFLFPVSIGVGFLLASAARLIRPFQGGIATIVKYYFHLPFSIAFLYSNILSYYDDGFQRFVSDERPSSLNIEAREIRSGMGYRDWMFALTVDPAEAGMIFSRFKYKQDNLSQDEVWESLNSFIGRYQRNAIPFNYTEFTDLHSYEAPDLKSPLSTGFRQVVFTTDPPGRVLVFGSDD